MRKLFILGGAPGAGKTTWVKENDLDNHTLRADDLRNLFMSPGVDRWGNPMIPFGTIETFSREFYRAIDEREKRTWRLIRDALEYRLYRGELTVVDATHTRRDYINPYVNVARKWRYRLYFVRFEVPDEILIGRNDPNKRGMKAVPIEEVLRKAEQLRALKVPRSFTEVTPSEAAELVSKNTWYPIDKPVFFIGDIHGVNNLLQKFIDEWYSPNALYVFVGDLVDRGPNSLDVLKTLMKLHKENKNIVVVEGNHDVGLWYWAEDEIWKEERYRGSTSKQTRKTIKEIEEELSKNNEDIEEFKKELRKFIRGAFSEYRSYLINDTKVLVTHALLPTIPDNGIDRLSHLYTIYGLGEYEEIGELSEIFANKHPDIVQIHGHRNPNMLPIRVTDNVFNLEGGIEFGGEFRAIKFYDKNDYEPITYKSDYVFVSFQDTLRKTEERIFSAASESKKIRILIQHPLIKVKKQKGPWSKILSLNFSPRAWRKRIWNKLTVTARGLFVDTKEMTIAMRGFNKFFYPGETDMAAEEILRESPAPYTIMRKHNGFLLLVSYHPVIDDIMWATKSAIAHINPDTGEVSNPFVHVAFQTMTPTQRAEIEDVVKSDPSYTYLFEVVNPELDPHVVLEHPGIYFLAKVKNTIMEYVVDIHNPFTNIPSPEVYQVVEKYDDIFPILEDVNKKAEELKNIEGTVIYDANNHPVFKHKTPFYSMWKKARGLLRILQKMRYVEPTRQGYEYRELIKIAAFMRDNVDKYTNKSVSILNVMVDYYGLSYDDFPFLRLTSRK